MKNVIAFMEQLGASAELQNLTENQALQLLRENFEVKSSGELHTDVAAMLAANSNLVCGVFAAEEGDEDIDTVTNSLSTGSDVLLEKFESLLDIRKNLVCGIFAAEESDEDEHAAA